MKPTPNNVAKMRKLAQINFDTWGEDALRHGDFGSYTYDHKTIADWVRYMARHDEDPDEHQKAREEWAYRPGNNIRPTIEDIARRTTHVLKEYGDRAYSGTVNFYKEEIDVKGDGSIWASAEYEVDYDWTSDPGDRVTPSLSNFDVRDVRLRNASFFTNDGEEIQISPEQATKALVNYFWKSGLDTDESLADQIQEQSQIDDNPGLSSQRF